MPLSVGARPGRAGLWITGTVTPAGASQGVRIRRRAGSDDPGLAAEEATALAAQILRDHHHGERRGSRGWAEAVASYRAFQDRSPGTIALLIRLTRHFRDTPLRQIDQAAIDRACRAILRRDAKPATRLRNVIAPVRAVLQHAARRRWCDPVLIEAPAVQARRTPCLTPAQFEALHTAMARHRPLLTWLVCTGCRRGETQSLDWRDIDLAGARARLWADTTKARRSRVVELPPAAVAAIASLPHRTGLVFGGANPRKALATASRKAGVPIRGLHDLRHTWASWQYAITPDLLRLKQLGGWSSTSQVEVYAHLMPAGHEDAIRQVWGLSAARRRGLAWIERTA